MEKPKGRLKLTRLVILIFALSICFLTSAQIKKKDLRGNWTTDNTDSLYFKNDTIGFLRSNSRLFCNNMDWSIQSRNKFSYSLCNCCIDPPMKTINIFPQKLKLNNNRIKIFVNNELFDEFQIVDLIDFNYNGLKTEKLILERVKKTPAYNNK